MMSLSPHGWVHDVSVIMNRTSATEPTKYLDEPPETEPTKYPDEPPETKPTKYPDETSTDYSEKLSLEFNPALC